MVRKRKCKTSKLQTILIRNCTCLQFVKHVQQIYKQTGCCYSTHRTHLRLIRGKSVLTVDDSFRALLTHSAPCRRKPSNTQHNGHSPQRSTPLTLTHLPSALLHAGPDHPKHDCWQRITAAGFFTDKTIFLSPSTKTLETSISCRWQTRRMFCKQGRWTVSVINLRPS